MILNGKSEVDFIKWASYNYGEDSGDLTMLREVYRNALIIEFFDSVGIYIGIQYTEIDSIGMYDWRIHYSNFYGTNNSRKEATIQAIKKANDIYNSSNTY